MHFEQTSPLFQCQSFKNDNFLKKGKNFVYKNFDEIWTFLLQLTNFSPGKIQLKYKKIGKFEHICVKSEIY